MSFNFRPLLNKFRVYAILNNLKRRYYNKNMTAALELSLNLSPSL